MRKTGTKALLRRKSVKTLSEGLKGTAIYLFFLSGIINVLALTGSFYMLQVYDRVLSSRSLSTLAALSALAIGLYLFQGVFDIIRSQIMIRIGARLDKKLSPLAHRVAIDMPRFGFSTAEALERGRDVNTVRAFFGTPGPIALFDLPWMPLYIGFAYVLHPLLGALAAGGAFLLALLTIVTELATHRLAASTQEAAIASNAVADANARNSDILRAMGLSGRAVARFQEANEEHLALQTRATDVTGTFGGFSKVIRMILQSAVLGTGAYLVVQGQLSAGAIIAASVASSRALAPVDMAIGNWKGLVAARRSWARLIDTLCALGEDETKLDLGRPEKKLTIDKLTVAAPSSGTVLLADVSFEVEAGQAVGLIGPSGGGKTTLAKALVGVWPVLRGSVRLDDAEIDQWKPEDLGRHIGYLPQGVALLDGTIAENIGRLEPEPDARAIIAAAENAGAHRLIVKLPDGYQTQMGPMGDALSAGQRQRVGLARALYGDPFLVVLDEPNSNLDAEGEAALTTAIEGIKARGGIAIVVAHRPSALAAVDMVGVIQGGRLAAFGPKDKIIPAQRPAVAAGAEPMLRPVQG